LVEGFEFIFSHLTVASFDPKTIVGGQEVAEDVVGDVVGVARVVDD
jgi:hypothetical protein